MTPGEAQLSGDRSTAAVSDEGAAKRSDCLAARSFFHSRSGRSILAAAMLLSLTLLLRVAYSAATQQTHGFSAYYTAARMLREGQTVARIYDDAWFRSQTVRLGFAGADDIYNLNPPTTTLLLWPVAGLDPRAARVAWTGFNLLVVILAAVGLAALNRGGPPGIVLALVAVATYQPLLEEIRLGQAYALLLLLDVALLWAYLRGRDVLAGVALGSMLIFKTGGLLMPLLFVCRRRWSALVWTVVTALAIVVLSLPWLGIDAWTTYLSLLTRIGGNPELAATAYQDLPGLWLHLLRRDAAWNPAPLLDAPAVAGALAILTALALGWVTFRAVWTDDSDPRSSPALAFAAWAALELILSPVSEDYHYSLLLVPSAIILAYWRDRQRDWTTLAILAVGIALVGAPLPYERPALAAGALALLAYPKLYGALLIWALAVRSLARWRPA